MAKSKKSERASTSSVKPAYSGRQFGAFNVLQIGSHYCYMRKHDGEDEKTIFLVNLPTDTTDRHIKSVFSSAGTIQSVKLWKPEVLSEPVQQEEELLRNGKKKDEEPPAIISLPSIDPRHPHHFLQTATSAHITFVDEASLQQALALSHIETWPDPFSTTARDKAQSASQNDQSQNRRRKANRISNGAVAASENQSSPPAGLEYLIARHRALRPSLTDVKMHVDSVIANYDFRRTHPTKKKRGIQAVSVGPNGEMLDEDGFTIVQSTGKYGRTADGEGGSSVKVIRRRIGADLEDDAASEKKRKRFELDDFYRFQRREQKREELASLRSKFREDQEKVKKLKASRSFKPF